MSETTETSDMTRAARVPGITIRQDLKKSATGKAWGLFVDVRLNGQRHNPSTFFATEAEAEAAYPKAAARLVGWRREARIEAELKAAIAPPRASGGAEAPVAAPTKAARVDTFETMAHRWLEEHVKPLKKASTYLAYRNAIVNHLVPCMGSWPVNDETLTKPRLRHLLKTELKARGASLKTRRFCQARLAQVLSWAMGELPPKQLTYNPAVGESAFLRTPEEEEPEDTEPNPMTRDQVEAFLTWITDHRPEVYELFLWSVDAGSRIGEVCAVQWTALTLDKGQAHIRGAFSSKHRRMERLKAGATSVHDEIPGLGETSTKTRRAKQYIHLSPRLVEALVALYRRNQEAWLSRGRYGKKPEHCFLNGRLQPRRPDRTVYTAFREACDALGLVGETGVPFTIHDLRATFVTLSILEGKAIGWVARMVGHKNELTIQKHYYKWIQLVEGNPLAVGSDEGRK